jgi:hypothetical protein
MVSLRSGLGPLDGRGVYDRQLLRGSPGCYWAVRVVDRASVIFVPVDFAAIATMRI